jgi:hypothetical protein
LHDGIPPAASAAVVPDNAVIQISPNAYGKNARLGRANIFNCHSGFIEPCILTAADHPASQIHHTNHDGYRLIADT